MKNIKQYIVALLFLVFGAPLIAQEYESAPVTYNRLSIPTSSFNVDDNINPFTGSQTYVEYTRELMVKLMYTRDQQTDVYDPIVGWSYTIEYEVISGATASASHFLTVKFNDNGEFIYDAIVSHPNAASTAVIKVVNTTFTGAGSPPIDIEFQAYFKGDIICDPSFYTVPLFPPVYNLVFNGEKLDASWSGYYCAEEFDLEWIFVDDKSIPAGTLVDNNFWGNNFDFNPLTKDGTLITTSDDSYSIDLTYPDGWLIVKLRPVFYYLDAFPEKRRREGLWRYKFVQLSGFETDKNWQFTSSYIEEGNHKTVGNYTDPTGKVRQTITNLNSENATIIAEQKYDYEGTPVVQFMPVPDNNSSLAYRTQYNLNAAGGAYLKTDYADIGQIASQASTSSGASKYYSSNNNSSSIHRDYIPDAQGYPLSQTQFDSKGRISKQGGVGELYQIGSEHETKFFYSSVSDTELNRLFGKNIGISKHYQKQYTQDPNGQLSVTYQDMEGKTIATALAGQSPDNLIPLDYATPTLLELNISGNGTINNDSTCSLIQHSLMNTVAGTNYNFTYDLQGITNQIGAPFNICLECKYALTIEVRGPSCEPNQLSIPNLPIGMDAITSTSGYTLTDTITGNQLACSTGYPPYNVSFDMNLEKIGTYTISKKLCALPLSIDEIEDLVMSSGLLPDSAAMIQDYIDNIDSSLCSIITENDSILNATLNFAPIAECDNLKRQMVDQISPNGAYYDSSMNVDFSLFTFYNDSGNTIALTEAIYLDVDQFREEWAETIVELHPEYCHYLACLEFVPSKRYDIRMSTNLDWIEASNTPQNNFNVDFTDPLNNDPFIDFLNANGGSSCSYLLDLSVYVTDLIHDFNGMFMNLEDFSQAVATDILSGSPSASSSQDQLKWFIYRGKYIDYKRQLIEQFIESPSPCGLDCPYLTISDALVDKQDEFDDINDQADMNAWLSDQASSIIDCNSLCGESVSIWMETIMESCTTFSEADSITIASGLEVFCINRCNDGQPFGYIIESDWNDNDDLQEVRDDLNLICSDTVLYQLVLPTVCDTIFELQDSNIVSHCFLSFLNQLNQNRPSCFISGSIGNIDSLDYDADLMPCNMQELLLSNLIIENVADTIGLEVQLFDIYLVDTLNMDTVQLQSLYDEVISLDSITSLIESFDTSFVNKINCDLIQLYDEFGVAIPFSTVSSFGHPQFLMDHPVSNSINGHTFNQITLQYLDLSCQVQTAYIFSDCDLKFDLFLQNSGSDSTEYIICAPDLSWNLIDTAANPCIDALQADAAYDAILAWNDSLTTLMNELYEAKTNCFRDPFEELLTITGEISEYHYTLYHYDQAGNLISTLPPEAIKPLNMIDPIADYDSQSKYIGTDPPHNWNLASFYEYNSINQISTNESPDGGRSNFRYDSKGMLRFSQNAKQSIENEWSYTKYDEQNRIKEVGQYGPQVSVNDTEIDDRSFPPNTAFTSTTVPHSKEIVKTFYDKRAPNTTISRSNLRSRVSGVLTMPYEGYISIGTYYGYDMVGNAKQVEQKIGGLESKIIDYEYDQLSGNVNEVKYNEGKRDEYFFKYEYDADNRLKLVQSSRNDLIYKTDATYHYYSHGPLARIELGHDVVQGLDYYYTLQGWTKGMNTPEVFNLHDPGQDGYSGANQWNARDTIAFALQYNNEDYTPIGTADIGAPTAASLANMTTNGSILLDGLYNGNIASMSTDIPVGYDNTNTAVPSALQAMAYQYDQLNRLKSSESYEPNINNLLQRTGNERYDATYSYDKLGNIKYLTRKGSVGQLIDDFEYNYTYVPGSTDLVNNQLQSVMDAQGDQGEGDLGLQLSTNYDYDAIGQLTKDEQANIQSIEWSASGKVKKIIFDGSHFAGVERMYFVYDGMDNRVQKIIDDADHRNTTHYVRDASGNILSTYNTESIPQNILDPIESISNSSRQVKAEQHLYGSSRLGIDSYAMNDTLNFNDGITLANNYAIVNTITATSLTPWTPPRPPRPKRANHPADNIQFEISNHLGNVLSTFSDLKLGFDNDADLVVDSYKGLIKSANDYYGFGMSMLLRSHNNHHFGFNGMEKDDAIIRNIYTAKYWEYNGNIGVRWNMDPEPITGFGKYVCFANNPILLNDPLGNTVDPTKLNESDKVPLKADLENKTGYTLKETETELGDKRWEIDKTKGINKKGTSRVARRELRRAINSDENITLVSSQETEMATTINNTILWNSAGFKNVKYSKGLNPTTYGLALTFFHEMRHTNAYTQYTSGRILKDPKYNGHWSSKRSYVDFTTNRIRKQLGPEYGKRMHYAGLRVSNANDIYTVSYLAFDKQSLKDLKESDNPPTGKYIEIKSKLK